jgi:surfactin synthase thioesterase subunit
MPLPEGWSQRVIWDEDPAFLKLVVLRDTAAASSHWLAAASEASPEPLPQDLSLFTNRREDVEGTSQYDPMKACNDALRAWVLETSLLPAMRPAVYIPLKSFPKNAAGKTDRGALPDPATVLEQISDAAAIAYEAPVTEDEHLMVEVWEKVLKSAPIGVSTPFVAYGGHSLTAIQLCSAIVAKFGPPRPDLVFLTSEDCTVRALLRRLKAPASESPRSSPYRSIVRLSPEAEGEQNAMPLLIFGAAGTSAATYQVVAEQSKRLKVYAVELPGRGQRGEEPLELNFRSLLKGLEAEVMKWAEEKRRFFAWGDSLGAIVAYEFARKWQASPRTSLMGLFVSGNAGPTVASRERGVGESVFEHLGLDRNLASCVDMSNDDWHRFLLASAAHPSNQEEMRRMLADPTLAEALIGPTRADCLAYESYELDGTAEKLTAPVFAMRGGEDHITTPRAVQSWKCVAGGRWDQKEFHKAGHMLARECPRSVAMCLDNMAWPDFSHELQAYNSFFASYRLMRTFSGMPSTSTAGGSPLRRQMSSSDIVSSTPKDDPEKLKTLEDLLMRVLPESITPQTMQVKIMRAGNAKWRQGCAEGNPMRNPN